MRTESAVICDAATFRDGLLNIIGAGISTISFTEFPANLPLTLAIRVVLETRELRPHHTVHVEITNALADQPEGETEVTFYAHDEGHQATEEVALATPVLLSGFALPRPGKYLITARMDEQSIGTFPLRVTKSEPIAPPPA